ncbi:MAG TPA: Flp pilus assembly protein CpaB [Anaerolineales bacterium]|nr:Flp pilus assembly protein CpaB [Anaerolineales bacterium]
MRRGRLLIMLAFILLMGVAAVYLVLRRLSAPPTTTGEGTPVAPDVAFIVIAAQDISRGSVIPPDAVITAPFPADSVVETMLTDTGQAVGYRARMDIARGLPVTQNMITLTPGDVLATGSDAALVIPPGMTAISIPISRLSSVGYALRDGDQVDVLASFLIVDLDPDFQTILPNETLALIGADGVNLTAFLCTEVKAGERGLECINPAPPPFGRLDVEAESQQPLFAKPRESQRPRLVTQRLIDYATVLHIGTFTLEEEEQAASAVPVPAQGVGAPGAPPQQTTTVTIRPPDIVTLIVTPQDALALNWAVKSGVDLELTLRSPGDTTVEDTTSVTLQYLVDNYDIAIPSKLSYGVEPRIDKIVPPVLPNDTPVAAPAPQ